MRARSISIFAILVAGACPSQAGLAREIEFRDGSRLVLELEEFEFELRDAEPGRGTKTDSAALRDTTEVVFASVPALQRVELILKALKSLRSDDYATRERAAQRLSQIGAGFRELIQKHLDGAADPEIRWRLRRVLTELPRTTTDDYDHIRLADGAWRGEIGEWQIRTVYRGSELRLNRESVRSIRQPRDAPRRAGGAAVEIVRSDEEANLPAAAQRISFERDPKGRDLHPGEDIHNRFVDWGCLLSSSIAESYVSVNPFNVDGSRGGQSAATHDPLYEGTVTVRFCMPGDASRPAGVHFVGCWLAIVEPGGTSLVAYNALGKEIGRAVTSRDGSEFLGLRSAEPIAFAEVVPTADIDSNFTLDDLTFDAPSPLSLAAHPTHFAVVLADGARLHCKSFRAAGAETGAPEDGYILEPAAEFTDALRFERRDLVALLPPLDKAEVNEHPDGVWALLADGSKVRTMAGAPSQIARGRIALDEVGFAALWNSRRELRPAPADLEIPEGSVAVLIRKDPMYLREVERRPAEFTAKRSDGSVVVYNYSRLPTVWFSVPPAPSEERGEVVLTNGERLSIGADAAYLLPALGSADDGVTVKVAVAGALDQTFRLPYSEIRSVSFPGNSAP